MSKEQALEETYDYYWMSALDSSYPLDRIEEYYAESIMGFGTPLDEKFFTIDDVLALIIRQREQSVGIEMSHAIKPVLHTIISNGNVAIFVDEVTLTMNIDGNKHEIFLRNTLIMEYLNNKWKVVHFHCSEPVNAKTETDIWNIEGWKRKNEELQKLVDERTIELKTSLENLKSTQAQLIQSEKLASLGELTAGIAHEIQNPLNFVNNFSEVSNELISELKVESSKVESERDKGLEDELLNDIAQNLTKINHHGKRASDIVKGMLEHSRTSTGQKELTDINALCNDYLKLAYQGLKAKNKDFNATMETHFDPNLPKIDIIPQDISRVMLNLINNAFYACTERLALSNAEVSRSAFAERLALSNAEVSRSAVNERSKDLDRAASPSGVGGKGGLGQVHNYVPTVSISTQLIANSQLLIAVKDNGSGIPETIKDKIFQPFFTTKPTGQGTGLGLSLAYDIVTKGHGGTLEVESGEGEGSIFIIQIPLKTSI